MIISVTERQLYKRCRRKWDLSSFNRQSLTPILNAPALELGTLIHQTLATWTSDPDLDPLEVYNEYAEQTKTRIILTYNEKIGCLPSQDELNPVLQAIILGRAMITNYQIRWRTPLPPGYTLVSNEQTLVIDIPNTEHCGCTYTNKQQPCVCATIEDSVISSTYHCDDYNDGLCACEIPCPQCTRFHQLEATLDGVMADEHGQLFIIERKTYDRRPTEDKLDEEDQFLAYMWALRQSGMGSVRGVSYDGLWKREKVPAGRVFEDLFLRRIQTRNEQELAEFEYFLPYEVTEMANSPALYKTVPPLNGCTDCNFRTLCKAISRQPQHYVDSLMSMYTKSNHKQWRKIDDENI